MTGRGRAALRVAATLLLAVAALLIRSATAPADGAAIAERDPRPHSATPFLSMRRVPQLIVQGAGAQRLQEDLAALLAPLGAGACAAVSDDLGRLASYQSAASLTPASTEKLLTAAAAISVLGVDHHLVTRTVVETPPRDGALDGDLYLIGGGDPILSTPGYAEYLGAQPRTRSDPVTQLSDLVDAIIDAGVGRIDGRIVADDTRHDSVRYLTGWKPSYRSEGQVGPLGALEVNDGFTSWSGRVGADDPGLHAASQLVTLLEERGVAVNGGVTRGTAPAGAQEIASVSSPPVSEIVAGMLTSSDNLTAELLAREVGFASTGIGTTEAGTDAIVAELSALGVPTSGVDLVDGSGLAPGNLVTCDALLSAVSLGDRPRFEALREGLADAGESGTLALRFVGDPLQGRLHAKTGQIDGVVGLAGVVDDGYLLRFALIANGAFSTAQGWDLQEQVADLVAAYPDSPPATDLVPLPGP